MRRLLLIGIPLLAVVALLAKVVLDQLPIPITEWRSYQSTYNELQRAGGLPAVGPRIQEITPSSTGKPERCVTCHLGMLPRARAHAHRAPYQAHPPLPCSLSVIQMGCIGCHRGDPLELTVEGAHALEEGSPRRVLDWRAEGGDRRLALQAGCAQCHLAREHGVLRYEPEIVPEIAAGMDLFLSRGCYACHRVAGVYRFSDAGPDLTRVGSRLSRRVIRRHLVKPQARRPTSAMPPTSLRDRELERLTLFLVAQAGPDRELGSSGRSQLASLGSPRLSDHFRSEYPASESPAAGALWARRVGCLGCHRLGEGDGGVPDLGLVGWITAVQELRSAITRPQGRFPKSYMPALEMPPAVVGSVVSYLALQKRPLPSEPRTVFAEVCGRCHASDRDPAWVVLNRAPPLLYGKGRRLPDRDSFVATVRKGSKGTAMAAWGRVLSETFLHGIYRHLSGRQR
jgi:mono/diheme cytochrome c family protein